MSLSQRIDRLMLFIRTGEWTGKRFEHPETAASLGQIPRVHNLLEVMNESDKGRSTITSSAPLLLNAADVAARWESERAPDAWRQGDEPFMVTVGEEPPEPVEPDGPDDDDDAGNLVTDQPMMPDEGRETATDKRPPKQQRGWMSADEFAKLFHPSERLKLLDGPNSDPVAPTCFVCGQPILEISLITAADGRKRHGDCWR